MLFSADLLGLGSPVMSLVTRDLDLGSVTGIGIGDCRGICACVRA